MLNVSITQAISSEGQIISDLWGDWVCTTVSIFCTGKPQLNAASLRGSMNASAEQRVSFEFAFFFNQLICFQITHGNCRRVFYCKNVHETHRGKISLLFGWISVGKKLDFPCDIRSPQAITFKSTVSATNCANS